MMQSDFTVMAKLAEQPYIKWPWDSFQYLDSQGYHLTLMSTEQLFYEYFFLYV
jgi:hypothetical protein